MPPNQEKVLPESKVRKAAATKHKVESKQEIAAKRRDRERHTATRSTAWVPYAFITTGLLGVAWLVVFYIAGDMVPGMRALGNWNVLVGMGLMMSAFGIATMWK
ncbi:uncharacterized protein UPF0233 [Luteococcus japonicus]|uniref:Cell division protein CrgA n=1 Tax=Luteococcus japonicus TaxID=33984 RepID=A0A3N1ZYE9_9ACTN|nr:MULTISPECIES: cell division protein CrgA [Luteococcus]MDN5563088.1 cell division protein CrgA [Luteococcus sp.]ROR55152.1 uncharacterized protein UPF0233 [Luteococcus japonicus]